MTISELYHILYKSTELLPRDTFTVLVDQHFQIFDLSKTITDYKEYDQTLRILSDYGILLSQNKDIQKSQPIVLRMLQLFENHPTVKHNELPEIKHYESLLFAKASNLFYLKKYRKSKNILADLTKNFPENKTYKRWYFFARNRAISRINLLALILFTVIWISLTFVLKSEQNVLPKPALRTATAIFAGMLAVELFLYLSNRRLKKTVS